MQKWAAMGSDKKNLPASVIVVSQVPPPHHGSTIMTQVFLETLDTLDVNAYLVERRFSTSVGDVGKFSLIKVLKSVGLLTRFCLALIRIKPAACVLFITNRPASFLVDWLMTEVLRFFNCPTVNYIHTNGYTALSERNRLFRLLVGRALGAARTTVCLGPALVADVSWAIKGDLAAIPNTPHRLPSVKANRGRNPVFLFLSNLIPEKGGKEFIQAAAELCESHSTVSFVVAGAALDVSIYRELEQLISDSPHAPRIKLLGKADEATKWQLLQTSHALVFPSTYAFEAQPLTIVEAMAMALPVIAYDVGGVRDLVRPGITGQLVKAKDGRALRAAMRQLLNDPTLVTTLGANARESFDSEFSRESYTSRWSRVLDSISNVGDGARR